jgi:hypothetical protein
MMGRLTTEQDCAVSRCGRSDRLLRKLDPSPWCPNIWSTVSSRLSLIEIQKPAEPAGDGRYDLSAPVKLCAKRDDVAEALMIALGTVVLDELGDDQTPCNDRVSQQYEVPP